MTKLYSFVDHFPGIPLSIVILSQTVIAGTIVGLLLLSATFLLGVAYGKHKYDKLVRKRDEKI